MAKSQTSSNTKCCATCEYWMGPRITDNWCRNVILEDDKTRIYAKCAQHLNSSTTKQAAASCSNYQKWGVLS